MPRYARVENNQVTEWLEIDELPAHKAHFWRPVVVEGSGPIRMVVIEETQVKEIFSQPPLAEVKAVAKAKVDEDAERIRGLYLTPGSGQAMEYQKVASEAARFIASGGLGEYPMLQASVTAGEGADLATVAAIINAREAAWTTIGAAIREKRLSTKAAIEAAESREAITAIFANLNWPGQ